jgi:hypothetical protein
MERIKICQQTRMGNQIMAAEMEQQAALTGTAALAFDGFGGDRY